MRNKRYILFLALAAALPVVAADDTSGRLGNAVDVFNTMTQSEHGIRAEQIASADCIAIIPGL
jgi:hypothetical protein